MNIQIMIFLKLFIFNVSIKMLLKKKIITKIIKTFNIKKQLSQLIII